MFRYNLNRPEERSCHLSRSPGQMSLGGGSTWLGRSRILSRQNVNFSGGKFKYSGHGQSVELKFPTPLKIRDLRLRSRENKEKEFSFSKGRQQFFGALGLQRSSVTGLGGPLVERSFGSSMTRSGGKQRERPGSVSKERGGVRLGGPSGKKSEKEKSEDFCRQLFLAAKSNDEAKISRLLASGGEIKELNFPLSQPAGHGVLHYAAWHGQLELVEFLRGIEELHKPSLGGVTPLMLACCRENVEVVRILVEESPELNASDGRGMTALHMAVERRNLPAVDLLLAKSELDVSLRDDKGRTALDCAPLELLLKFKRRFAARDPSSGGNEIASTSSLGKVTPPKLSPINSSSNPASSDPIVFIPSSSNPSHFSSSPVKVTPIKLSTPVVNHSKTSLKSESIKPASSKPAKRDKTPGSFGSSDANPSLARRNKLLSVKTASDSPSTTIRSHRAPLVQDFLQSRDSLAACVVPPARKKDKNARPGTKKVLSSQAMERVRKLIAPPEAFVKKPPPLQPVTPQLDLPEPSELPEFKESFQPLESQDSQRSQDSQESQNSNRCQKSSDSSLPVDLLDNSDSPELPHSPSLRDFILHSLIGSGSFGEVYLSELESLPSRYFALKVLKKSRVRDESLSRYVLTERMIMSKVRHPFIAPLRFAFQSRKHLFLAMDFYPGGNLSDLLVRDGRLSESRTRVILAELALAIEELHKQDIVYRDLKPENVVLDSEGHALLIDFGLSKHGVTGISKGAKSFCGSCAYLAPEMLGKKGHGKALDWYLLGVLAFELLNGDPPFYSDDQEELFRNIESMPLEFKTPLSPHTEDFIAKLLDRDPLVRLGGRLGAKEVKDHPFFAGLCWETALARGLLTPTPRIRKLRLNQLSRSKLFLDSDDEEENEEGESLSNDISGWTFVEEQ